MKTELTQVLETSKALSAALEAVQGMNLETIEDRQRRLSEGRASHTGWPIKRITINDGLTIPEKMALAPANRNQEAKAIAMFMGVLADEREADLSKPAWWEAAMYLAAPLIVVAMIVVVI